MNLSRCLTVTLLLVAVVVVVSFLAVFLSKRSKSSEDTSEPTPSETPAPSAPSAEMQELKSKLEQKVDDARKLAQDYEQAHDQMKRGVLEEHEKALEELDRKHKAALEELKRQYETGPRTIVDLEALETPDLELIFEVPPKDVSWSYQVDGKKINVTKEEYTPEEDVVKYTHRRSAGYFNLKTVRIGPRSFPLEPPADNVLLVTVYALVVDSGFPYYIMAGSKGKDPELYENTGKKFVIAGDFTSFKEEMNNKAKMLGRKTSPAKPGESSLRTEPEQSPGAKAVFRLDAKFPFQLGSDELKLKISSEYENKYTTYFYFVEGKTIRPDKFDVRGVVQKGLPVGQLFNGIVVYYATGVDKTPLLVKFLYAGQETFYLNSSDNNWTSTEKHHLEELLDFLDSHLNNRIVLNVGRRSDYHRNGTGTSRFETTKDVGVYVETDKPALGWNTYTHVLEVGGEEGNAQNFYVSRMVFGNYKFLVCPKKEVEYVETYAKSNSDDKTAPTAVFVKYADGNHEYYLKVGTEYLYKSVSNLDINENNLVEKMENALSPLTYSQMPTPASPTTPPTPTEVEVVLSRKTTHDYFTTVAQPDPSKFPVLTFPGYTAYAHVFKNNVKVNKYTFNNTTQTGLPTDELLSGVLVYFKDNNPNGLPMVVCKMPPGSNDYKCYVRNDDDNWVLFLELETLDPNDSNFTQQAVDLVNKHYKLS